MCGIAGRILNNRGKVGNDLVDLMDAQVHRGADSTGFALYGTPIAEGFIVRAMASQRTSLPADLEAFRSILKAHGSDFLEKPTWDEAASPHASVRMLIAAPKNLAMWVQEADTFAHRLEIQSVGKSLEIIKDLGDAQAVAQKHQVRDFIGTHGLGHARLATESSVSPTASHPFWARPFPDVAIVHNGQITNYFLSRNRLERKGYRFMTENDSELLAVWISDRMSQGVSQAAALRQAITEIDGVFTFLIADPQRMGFVKDRFAMKPLVAVEENDKMAIATEEQAVRTIYPHEVPVLNYDGPSLHNTWEILQQKRAA